MDFDGLPYVVPANSAAKKTERIKIKARFGQRKRLFINFQHRQKRFLRDLNTPFFPLPEPFASSI